MNRQVDGPIDAQREGGVLAPPALEPHIEGGRRDRSGVRDPLRELVGRIGHQVADKARTAGGDHHRPGRDPVTVHVHDDPFVALGDASHPRPGNELHSPSP
ncbi:MAG: hypothetical protein ACE5GB_03245, partial [Acidimicrobiales bacterium]